MFLNQEQLQFMKQSEKLSMGMQKMNIATQVMGMANAPQNAETSQPGNEEVITTDNPEQEKQTGQETKSDVQPIKETNNALPKLLEMAKEHIIRK